MLMFYKYILHFMTKTIVLLGGADRGSVWTGCPTGYIWRRLRVGGIIVPKTAGNPGRRSPGIHRRWCGVWNVSLSHRASYRLNVSFLSLHNVLPQFMQ